MKLCSINCNDDDDDDDRVIDFFISLLTRSVLRKLSEASNFKNEKVS